MQYNEWKSNIGDLTENNFLCLLSWIRINSPGLILAYALFKSLADLFMFPTTGNRDVSSTKSFVLDTEPSEILNHQISCLCILEKNGPSIELCGIFALMTDHEGYGPFTATLCFL